MKKINIILGLLCLNFTAQANLDLRPEAQPNKKLDPLADFLRTACDFICEESFGIKALTPENENFIRVVINDLKMNDFCIELRSMSNYAQQGFSLTDIFIRPLMSYGRTTIFSMPSIFGRKSHAKVYVSEEWFSTLSEQEKQALIRQELMKLKLGQFSKQVCVLLASLVGCYALHAEINFLFNNPEDDYRESYIQKKIASYSYPISYLFGTLINAAYSRMCQREADSKAVATMNNKEGFVNLLKNMKNNTEDIDSKFWVKRLINTVVKPFMALIRFDQSFDERIENISAL